MAAGSDSIDQAIFDAMRGVEYLRPAIVRPYLELAEIPSAAAELKAYYQDKQICKKLEVSFRLTGELEISVQNFLKFSGERRIALSERFAENKAKIEQRHLDNLGVLAEDLEKAAREGSAEGAALLKKLSKKFKILAHAQPKHKQNFEELLARLFVAGDKSTEEIYNMALFMRALRAEYSMEGSASAYFEDSQTMKAYLRGLAA